MSKNTVHEGWLTKSPPNRRIWRTRWRRRWFSLRQSSDVPGQYFLDYYSDRNCRRLKGTIDLDLCEQVDAGLRMERNNHAPFNPKIRGSVFTIQTHQRVYHLEADCEDDMEKWVDAICRVCGLRSTEKPPIKIQVEGELKIYRHNVKAQPPCGSDDDSDGPPSPGGAAGQIVVVQPGPSRCSAKTQTETVEPVPGNQDTVVAQPGPTLCTVETQTVVVPVRRPTFSSVESQTDEAVESQTDKPVESQTDKPVESQTDEPAVPGPSVPGPSVPGPSVPGPSVPGPSVPGPIVPGRSVPGPSVPRRSVPGPSVPGRSVPGPSVPGRSVPGPSVSGPNVPGPSVAGPSVPGPSVSGPSVPGPSVRGPSVPGRSVPGRSVPGRSVPGPSVPGPSVPEEAEPKPGCSSDTYQNSVTAPPATNEHSECADGTGPYIPISECITGVRAQDEQRAFTFDPKNILSSTRPDGQQLYSSQSQFRLNTAELSENESNVSDEEEVSLHASHHNIPDWSVTKSFTKLTVSPKKNGGVIIVGPPVPPRPPKTFAVRNREVQPKESFQGPKIQEPAEVHDNAQQQQRLRSPRRMSQGAAVALARPVVQLVRNTDDEEETSPGHASMQYCNLPSLPPAVDRALKPRHSSVSVGHINTIMTQDNVKDVKDVKVLKNVKVVKFVKDINVVKFVNDVNDVNVVKDVKDVKEPHSCYKCGCSSHSALRDPQPSTSTAAPSTSGGSQHIFVDEAKSDVLQYLDLDLPTSKSSPSKGPEPRIVVEVAQVHSQGRQAQSTVDSDSAYKTVDFLKTEAFNITRQDAEASRLFQY